MVFKCKHCGKPILIKSEFITELAEKYSIEVDPNNVDLFRVSGVGSFDAYEASVADTRVKYEEVQKKRAFQCQSCGATYCMECLLKEAPAHANGGKACFACLGALWEL